MWVFSLSSAESGFTLFRLLSLAVLAFCAAQHGEPRDLEHEEEARVAGNAAQEEARQARHAGPLRSARGARSQVVAVRRSEVALSSSLPLKLRARARSRVAHARPRH